MNFKSVKEIPGRILRKFTTEKSQIGKAVKLNLKSVSKPKFPSMITSQLRYNFPLGGMDYSRTRLKTNSITAE